MHYHIIDQAPDQKTINVIFHIPVPAGTNSANVEWKDAIVQAAGPDGITSVLTNVDPTEGGLISTGEVIEHREVIRFSKLSLTNAEKKAEIEAAYTARKTIILAGKQLKLQWIGFSADVA